MPLPRKPRVPIPSNPDELVALALRIKESTEFWPPGFADNATSIQSLYASASAKQIETKNKQMEYKQTVIERDAVFAELKDQMRIVRDKVFGENREHPEKIADFGFDMLVSPETEAPDLPPQVDGEGDSNTA